MGALSKIIGLAIAAAGAFLLWWGLTPEMEGLSLILFFLGIILMSIGSSILFSGKSRSEKEEEPEPPTVTELQCQNPNCDFKEIRDFEKGDYILKEMEQRCPKCEGTMMIEGIYIVRKEEEKPEF
ncbi:MAG: hypothetical protein BAJATHORv1_20587 [Candidatus Thorarchaeota archaeon]|nr:MAG: hypothetical protein BAJATHORv1_20587 [Candidatus Thorarchaeota archaeon]